MKQGWEIKKLGEVCSIMMGQSPSSDTYNDSNGLPFFQGNADFGKIHPKVRVFCNAPIRIADVNDILISVRAPIGAINIADCRCCIGRGLAAIRNLDTTIGAYIYHALITNKEKLIAQGTGSTFKSIGREALKELYIPVPPIEEQERIVAELDCLSGIIEKKREQLKEYDALAESIFYTMFGDPITNEKGWKVKKLGEVCAFQQGVQVPIEAQFEEQQDGMNRFLRIVDFTQGNEKPRYVHINSEKHILKEGEIAIVRYGSPGFVCYGKYGVIANNLFKIIPLRNNLSYVYFVHWLKSDAFQSIVSENQYGAALQAIKFSTIKDIATILPPITLQQEFADKIEAIEKQKELIKESIKETEELFNSRMDYYFG